MILLSESPATSSLSGVLRGRRIIAWRPVDSWPLGPSANIQRFPRQAATLAMNLFDMARRADPNLVLTADIVGRASGNQGTLGRVVRALGRRTLGRVARMFGRARSRITPSQRRIHGEAYRGFEMTGGTSFRLVSPYRWYPFRALPHYTGWEVVALGLGGRALEFEIALIDRATGHEVARESHSLGPLPRPIPLPKLFGWERQRFDLDMRLAVKGSARASAFLSVHPVLERKELLRLCRGRGVELGPGPNPQILPGADIDVTYVEAASAEQWESLYNQKGNLHIDSALWARYVQGGAHPLPVESGSLDFIFASHVFEHLANPLGHLEHWRGKLRSGGVIAAVVPDLAGSKDYVFAPSSITEILEERAAGYMEPQLRHFQRWAAVRAPGRNPQEFIDLQRSIHAHFYTHANIQELLEMAVKDFGFARYDLRYVPNHKDFYFALWK
jgi:SAM-dependent methyltransferase